MTRQEPVVNSKSDDRYRYSKEDKTPHKLDFVMIFSNKIKLVLISGIWSLVLKLLIIS
jgi:hypothetical protein